MPPTTQTDNDFLAAKLAVRRHFLRKYHGGGGFRVLDCCEGAGVLWELLGREFACEVWGVDLKPARGRLKVDSRRLLAGGAVEADVIDVDAYGSPWRHWLALLDGPPRPLTAFLTWGLVRVMGGRAAREEREVLGLTFPTLDAPDVLVCAGPVQALVAPRMFARAVRGGWRLVEVKEAPRGRSARYFGVRLEPGPEPGGSGTPG